MPSNDAHTELMTLSEEFFTFSRDVAHKLIDLPEETIDDGLEDLVEIGFLQHRSEEGEPDAFEYKHGMDS